MLILVTGAGGFLGKHVVKQLLERDYDACAMVKNIQEAASWQRQAKIIEADLLDEGAVLAALKGVDIVIHCGAKLPDKAGPNEIWDVNVYGTRNIVNACAQEGVKKLVYISSDSVYGDGDNKGATEETPINPVFFREGNYPRSKYEGELLVQQLYAKHGIPITIIRPCFIYGPGESANNDVLVKHANKSLNFMLNKGESKQSVAYVEDVANATIQAATQETAAGQCYNISDGVCYSKYEVLKALEEVSGHRKRLLKIPGLPFYYALRILYPFALWMNLNFSEKLNPQRILFSINNHYLDIGKIQTEISYRPQVLLKEGLKKTFAWHADPWSIL